MGSPDDSVSNGDAMLAISRLAGALLSLGVPKLIMEYAPLATARCSMTWSIGKLGNHDAIPGQLRNTPLLFCACDNKHNIYIYM